MMKKIFLILFVFSCFSYASYAYDKGTVYLKHGNQLIEIGEEIEMNLVIENTRIAACTTYIYFDNNKLEYISGPENANVVQNKIIYVWYDKTGGSDLKSGELMKIKFKAKKIGTAGIRISGEFYDVEGDLLNTNFQSTKVIISDMNGQVSENEKSSEANLEVLAIEDFLLNPAFDANITYYEVEISNEDNQLNILAIPQNEEYQVEISGNDLLKEGENLIRIIVTDKNKLDSKIYEINAIKRTEKEEIMYEQGQMENQERLEKIYRAEKLSEEVKDNFPQTEFQNSTENSHQKMVIFLMIIFFVTILGVFMIKHSNRLKFLE